MMFLFNCVIFGFQPLIFRGVVFSGGWNRQLILSIDPGFQRNTRDPQHLKDRIQQQNLSLGGHIVDGWNPAPPDMIEPL